MKIHDAEGCAYSCPLFSIQKKYTRGDNFEEIPFCNHPDHEDYIEDHKIRPVPKTCPLRKGPLILKLKVELYSEGN